MVLSKVSLRRGQHVLLKSIDWTIYPKHRFGIIGANGSGKSSLFSMILGKLHPDTGDLSISPNISLAHVVQEMPHYNGTALDYVLDGDKELRRLESNLHVAKEKEDGTAIANIHEQFSIIDAYTAPTRAAQLLAGLGFSEEEQKKSVSDFSGGWRVRLNLAQALMCRSDVLLLDEPTNHLDLDAVLWLEDWLIKYPGTLLLISHDREFLDKTINQIAHIAHQQLKIYKGNYSAFETQRGEHILLQQASYEKQQKALQHMQAYVDRFRYKASKARQAQSRLKAIERMDLICAVQTESPFNFSFKKPKNCSNPLMKLEHVNVGYANKNILTNVNLVLSAKERIAILGPNGAGKSTLIKLLAGELAPLHGVYEVSPGLKVGYFAQHQVEQLNLHESPLFHMKQLGEQTLELELRKYLGSFGFAGDRVLEPIKTFSGGEKSRLALALIVWQQPNLLLLDEPTNHLDLDMRSALSIALQEYEGAMILVSHDRFLVRTTTDQLLLVADGALQEFDGDLNDYEKWLLAYRASQKIMPEIETDFSRKEQRQIKAKDRELRRPLIQKVERLEKEIDKLQKEVSTLNKMLTDPTLYEAENKKALNDHLMYQAKITKQLQQYEHEWLQACDERDK